MTLAACLQVSAAFRIEVLSEVPGMSQRAVARLAKKLDEAAKTGSSVEIGEEMRHLTLQVVIAVFFLSCPVLCCPVLACPVLP